MISPGSEKAFLTAIQSHKGILYKVANAYAERAEDRQDLVQEMILQLWRSFDRYDNRFALSTWMYRIALNVAISQYRREKSRNNLVTGMPAAILEMADQPENHSADAAMAFLQRFIAELKELDRALVLLYLDDKPYREIADILGISESNVSTKIGRIKTLLKQRYSTANH